MVAICRSEKTIADKIYEFYEKENEKPIRLTRIGASIIGKPCLREIWLSWRAYDVEQFNGRMLRLFQTGQLQEDRIQQDLIKSGFAVWTHQDDGEQFTYTDKTGHFVAKLDGVIKGVIGSEKTPHDLEIKTHSVKSFDKVVKYGVEKAKPVHFYQMQAGMLYSNLTRALYVALCKNDENYHIERIYPDNNVQKTIELRIKKLLESRTSPVGMSDNGTSQDCKYCGMRSVCVGEKSPIKTCRSCDHVEVVCENGAWRCSLFDKILNSTQQVAACENYEVIS